MILEPLALPTEPDQWSGWLAERGIGSLRLAADQVAALKTAHRGDTAILQLWNDAGVALANASAVAGLLSSVHPDAGVVEQAEALEVEVRRFSTDLLLDADVFALISSIRVEPLDDGARRVVADALRAFRRAGVVLDEETRERLRELNDRETELSQAFSRNIRDGRRTASVPATALAGLPEDYVAEW